jgi:Ca2+-binding RTX toxin-like protein
VPGTPGSLGSNKDILINALPSFSGLPSEYAYVLELDGAVTVTDSVTGRDEPETLAAGTVQACFAGVVYNLVVGTNGDDVLVGSGTIEDDAAGLNNEDLILGFGGNDSLRGINGNDFLFGGDGADKLYGDNDNDYLAGEGGNDTLYPGSGNDTSLGGAGTDLVVLAEPANTGQAYNGGDDAGDKLLLANGYGSFTMIGCAGFEKFSGGDGDDAVDWSDAAVALEMRGNAGNDILIGGSGNDIIRGFTDNDTLAGNEGADHIYGEDGDDALSGGQGADTLYTGAGNDAADAGEGDGDTVVLETPSPSDTIAGGVGNGRPPRAG